MIEEASVAIENSSALERRLRQDKYARRHKLHYIDTLLNELEMLNLAERTELPANLGDVVDRIMSDSGDARRAGSVVETMDLLYELQDELMESEDDEEA
jgi:hypothetical protein